MTQEDLQKQLRDSDTLSNRLVTCQAKIGKMCSERRPPKMTIPVQWDDDDFYISTTIKDEIAQIQILNSLVTEYENALASIGITRNEDWEDWMGKQIMFTVKIVTYCKI